MTYDLRSAYSNLSHGEICFQIFLSYYGFTSKATKGIQEIFPNVLYSFYYEYDSIFCSSTQISFHAAVPAVTAHFYHLSCSGTEE